MMSEQEYKALADLIDETGFLPTEEWFLEIGAQFGDSTRVLYAQEHSVITVDNLTWNCKGFNRHEHRNILQNVIFNRAIHLEMDSVTARRYLGNLIRKGLLTRPSILFLDADHSFEQVDAEIRWGKQYNIPVICGHDYCEQFPGVMESVDTNGGVKKLTESFWVLKHGLFS